MCLDIAGLWRHSGAAESQSFRDWCAASRTPNGEGRAKGMGSLPLQAQLLELSQKASEESTMASDLKGIAVRLEATESLVSKAKSQELTFQDCLFRCAAL